MLRMDQDGRVEDGRLLRTPEQLMPYLVSNIQPSWMQIRSKTQLMDIYGIYINSPLNIHEGGWYTNITAKETK